MISKQEVIKAVQTDGFFVKDDFVYVWKRGKINHAFGCDLCPFISYPGSLSICNACLELDVIMPRSEDDSRVGYFEYANGNPGS